MNIRAASLILLILLGASFLFLYDLGAQPLHNDEARYAEVVKESFTGHTSFPFALTYRGEPYFNKPPLLFWLVNTTHAFVGNMQVAVRLPSAVGGILLVAATMLVVFEATGSLYAAAFGGGILATMASLILLSRSGRFDTLATLFVVLATYAFIRAFKNKKWFLLFGVCIGLAIMTKGPVAVFAFLGAGASAFIYKKFDWLRDPYFWGGAACALLIVLPWHLYETLRYGGLFWNEYIFQQIIARVQSNIVSVALPLSNKDYVTYIFSYLAPWSAVFSLGILALPLLWPRVSTKARAYIAASIAEIYGVILVCFLVQSKAYRYLVPFYPFLAITIALITFEISRLKIPRIKTALTIGASSLMVWAFAWSAYTGFLLNSSYPYSTDTPASAYDERAVAQILVERGAKTFYVSNTADIGGIMYYSQLTNPYYFPLYGYYPGLYFVLPAAYIPAFENMHPRLEFSILYEGPDLVLAQEVGEAGESTVAPYCAT